MTLLKTCHRIIYMRFSNPMKVIIELDEIIQELVDVIVEEEVPINLPDGSYKLSRG